MTSAVKAPVIEAGLIGSHTVDALLKEDVARSLFMTTLRGRTENLMVPDGTHASRCMTLVVTSFRPTSWRRQCRVLTVFSINGAMAAAMS